MSGGFDMNDKGVGGKVHAFLSLLLRVFLY
jgi:hypothetical protein